MHLANELEQVTKSEHGSHVEDRKATESGTLIVALSGRRLRLTHQLPYKQSIRITRHGQRQRWCVDLLFYLLYELLNDFLNR
jgi:hypothetical protein